MKVYDTESTTFYSNLFDYFVFFGVLLVLVIVFLMFNSKGLFDTSLFNKKNSDEVLENKRGKLDLVIKDYLSDLNKFIKRVYSKFWNK